MHEPRQLGGRDKTYQIRRANVKTQSKPLHWTAKLPPLAALRKRSHHVATARHAKQGVAAQANPQPIRRLPLPGVGLIVWEG
jgi:hypothetical protein